MKKLKVAVVTIGAVVALTLTGCVATWTPPSLVVSSPPVVAVQGPDVIVAGPMVPEAYAWDGFEYVGFVGGSYVYFGPGGVWCPCEPWRLNRFHGWEGGHRDWRSHPESFGGGRGGRGGRGPIGHPGGPQHR